MLKDHTSCTQHAHLKILNGNPPSLASCTLWTMSMMVSIRHSWTRYNLCPTLPVCQSGTKRRINQHGGAHGKP